MKTVAENRVPRGDGIAGAFSPWTGPSKVAAAVLFAFLAFPLQADPMTFRVEPSRSGTPNSFLIYAEGDIVPGTEFLLQEILEDMPPSEGGYKYREMFVNSPGGDLGTALKLGRLMREHGVQVTIGDYWDSRTEEMAGIDAVCLSACAYAVMGATSLYFDDGISSTEVVRDGWGELGFHQFHDADVLSNRETAAFSGIDRLRDQFVAGELVSYLIEMGRSPRIYAEVSNTPPGEMLVVREELSRRMGLAEVSAEEAAAMKRDETWTILPWGDGLRLENLHYDHTGLRLFCEKGHEDSAVLQILKPTDPATGEITGTYASIDLERAEPLLAEARIEWIDSEHRRHYAEPIFTGVRPDPDSSYDFLVEFRVRAEDLRTMLGFPYFSLSWLHAPGWNDPQMQSKYTALMSLLYPIFPERRTSTDLDIMWRNCR